MQLCGVLAVQQAQDGRQREGCIFRCVVRLYTGYSYGFELFNCILYNAEHSNPKFRPPNTESCI